MSAASGASSRHFGVKRIMKEYAEFEKEADTNDYFTAKPCEDNLFEWHFTIRGPPDSDFAGGRYHGRILLPSQYPFKPPDIVMLTPSGRFETHKKICLSISSFHPKNWQPSWSIRTVLTALIAFFPTPGNGAIGSLEYSSHERKEYAARSNSYTCDLCAKSNLELLPDLPEGVSERAGMPTLSKEVTDMIETNRSIPALTAAGAAAQAGTASSQPGTPNAAARNARASGAIPPPTPLNLTEAERIAALASTAPSQAPSNCTSPLLNRTYSAPVALSPGQDQANVGEGEMLPPPNTALTTPHSSSVTDASAAATPSLSAAFAAAAVTTPAASATIPQASALSPLQLDEGVRQRQGRVMMQTPLQPVAPVPAAVGTAPVPAPAPASAPVPAAAPVAGVGVVAAPVRAAPLSSVTVFLSFLILLILARKLHSFVSKQPHFGNIDLPEP